MDDNHVKQLLLELRAKQDTLYSQTMARAADLIVEQAKLIAELKPVNGARPRK